MVSEKNIDANKLKPSRSIQENHDGSLILIEIKQEKSCLDDRNDDHENFDPEVVPENISKDKTNSNDTINTNKSDLENQSLIDLTNSAVPDLAVGYCTKCSTTYKYEINKRKAIKECYKCKIALKFKCPDCAKLYNSLDKARRHHKYTCNKEPRFSCTQCDFKTTTGFNMGVHMQAKHREPGPKTNQCYKCGLMYETHRYLLQHEKICGIPLDLDKKNYRYFCDDCDYKSAKKVGVRKHIQYTHAIPDNIPCPTCGRVFKLKKYLKLHVVTSRRCAKKALEIEKTENIPLSQRKNDKKMKNTNQTKRKNKSTLKGQEKSFRKSSRKFQEELPKNGRISNKKFSC